MGFWGLILFPANSPHPATPRSRPQVGGDPQELKSTGWMDLALAFSDLRIFSSGSLPIAWRPSLPSFWMVCEQSIQASWA